MMITSTIANWIENNRDMDNDRVILILSRWLAIAIVISIVARTLITIPSPTPFLSVFEWIDGLFQNFGTEMIGAILTFVLIEVLVGAREKEESEQAEEARKQEIQKHIDDALKLYRATLEEQESQALINQLSSAVPGLPAEAVRLLRHKGWLKDKDIAAGLRAGGDFHLTDLRKVVLTREDMRASKLSQANLEGVSLEGAQLEIAELEGAVLEDANLEGTVLQFANLERAVRVTIEQLTQAKSLEGATLPDGTKLLGRTPKEIADDKPEPDWREAFEEWCKTVPVDEEGCIIID